jgi:cyclase
MQDAGAGEIFLNSVEKDGTFEGYDMELIGSVSKAVSIPVVAVGGAGSVEDFTAAIQQGASAAAAGSLFVFQRPHRAVLISRPARIEG